MRRHRSTDETPDSYMRLPTEAELDVIFNNRTGGTVNGTSGVRFFLGRVRVRVPSGWLTMNYLFVVPDGYNNWPSSVSAPDATYFNKCSSFSVNTWDISATINNIRNSGMIVIEVTGQENESTAVSFWTSTNYNDNKAYAAFWAESESYTSFGMPIKAVDKNKHLGVIFLTNFWRRRYNVGEGTVDHHYDIGETRSSLQIVNMVDEDVYVDFTQPLKYNIYSPGGVIDENETYWYLQGGSGTNPHLDALHSGSTVPDLDGSIGRFAWGTSGVSDYIGSGTEYMPWSNVATLGTNTYSIVNLTGDGAHGDWGIYNACRLREI